MKSHTRSKALAFAVAAALVPAIATMGVAQAQDYQFEGGLSYVRLDPDFGSSDSAFGVDLTWHWEPVRTAGQPLQEAAFMTRNGSLQASYFTFDDADLDLLSVGAEVYVDRLYLAAEYERFSNGATSDDFVLGIGYVPVDGLRIAARYLIADIGDDAIIGEVKYVTLLGGGTALNLEGSVEFVDDDADTKLFGVLADYYVNPSFSIGARFVYVDDDFGSDTGWGVGAKYFFTPTISGEVEYFSDDFVDSIGVRVAMRF
jgi:hypothetical protein